MMLKQKIIEWLKRYGVAELVGICLTLIASNAIMFLTGNIILAAFLAPWAENAGFYGLIAFNDLKHRKRKDKKSSISGTLKVLRNMMLEFGPAEYLDSFAIRPFFLALLPLLIANYSLAILAGTMLANITYYIPTIISYETRKKILKD